MWSDVLTLMCCAVCCAQGLAHLCGLKHLPSPEEMHELTAGVLQKGDSWAVMCVHVGC